VDLVPLRPSAATRCPIVDTWWQTETGAMMISPLPGVTACKPGSAMRALPGIGADGRRRPRRTPVVGRVAAATSC
jgi:acyl-coenzyme A synthetase/AMP-(fatty) acid ligase